MCVPAGAGLGQAQMVHSTQGVLFPLLGGLTLEGVRGLTDVEVVIMHKPYLICVQAQLISFRQFSHVAPQEVHYSRVVNACVGRQQGVLVCSI